MTPNESSEATPHPDPPYDIVNFWCGDKDKTEMTVMCYNRRFDILALAKNMEECLAIKREFFDLIKDLLSMDNDDFQFKPSQPDPMEEMCYCGGQITAERRFFPAPLENQCKNMAKKSKYPCFH
ncbi:hypothetical protein GX50_08889 [[Emmonsia] crescens]|uniref:Uncharacterized protein n=1 Tax=[Emmonsia] crescens TaxID=73230 RepID=A0A2B7YWC2_9EURO|nr:hypothetical protein GX50_08889 [Emmonsia crescens]